MTFLDSPKGSRGPWVRIRSQIFDITFTWIADGEVEDTLWTTTNMYIKWKVLSSWASFLFEPSAKNVPFLQKLKVELKSKSKCMENVLNNLFYYIFQNDATTWCNFDVHQSCRAWNDLSFDSRAFLNPLSKFRKKLKIKTFTILNVLKCMENVLDKLLNLIYQTDVTVGFLFDVRTSCRAPKGLSYHWTPILNPLSEFREKVNIKPFTLKNVLECLENVRDKFLNWIFHIDATIDCNFDVHKSYRSRRDLSYRWTPF